MDIIKTKLKGTKKGIREERQIIEYCRAKPALKNEKDLTIH